MRSGRAVVARAGEGRVQRGPRVPQVRQDQLVLAVRRVPRDQRVQPGQRGRRAISAPQVPRVHRGILDPRVQRGLKVISDRPDRPGLLVPPGRLDHLARLAPQVGKMSRSLRPLVIPNGRLAAQPGIRFPRWSGAGLGLAGVAVAQVGKVAGLA